MSEISDPVREAAKAAFQVPESHESFGSSGAADTIVRYPSTAIYNQVFETVLLPLEDLAVRKNVSLSAAEISTVAHYALEKLPRKILRGVMACDPAAIEDAQQALNHALDVLACARIVCMARFLQGKPLDAADIIPLAEAALVQQFANDTAPIAHVWPDTVKMVADHFARLREQEATPPLMTLPGSATRRVSVQRTRKRAKKAHRSC